MNTVRTSWSTTSVTQLSTPQNTPEMNRDLQAGGGLTINDRSREVFINKEPVELTKTEFDLLCILAGHPRQVFTSRQLFQLVWASHYFDADHVIETHISRLRRKLGESGTQPRYIHTVRGVGYRFEPQPDVSPSNPQSTPSSPHRFHVRLTPDLHVVEIDLPLAALLDADPATFIGRPIADVIRGLAMSDLTRFSTVPVRGEAGDLVGINLEVWPKVPDSLH